MYTHSVVFVSPQYSNSSESFQQSSFQTIPKAATKGREILGAKDGGVVTGGSFIIVLPDHQIIINLFFFLSLSLSLFFSPVPYREHGAAGVRRFRDDLESDNRAAPAEIGRTKKRGDEDGKKSKADIRSRNKKKKVKKTH